MPDRMILWIVLLEWVFIFGVAAALIGALAFRKRAGLACAVGLAVFAGSGLFARWLTRGSFLRLEVIFYIALVAVPGGAVKMYEWLGSKQRRGRAVSLRIAPVLAVAAFFGILAFYAWRSFEANTKALENQHVNFNVERDEVAERGRISGATREISLEQGRWALWWNVKTSDGENYLCSWDGGYSGFSKGESVVIVHLKSGDIDEGGLLVALDGEQWEHLAWVGAIDEDLLGDD